MIRAMPPANRNTPLFVPRVTFQLILGVALFFASMLLYVSPILFQDPPPGAIPDWHKEQVQARLEGKVLLFALGSLGLVAVLSMRGLLPWSGPRSRT